MRALFIVDTRPEAGLGHVVRSGALRDELTRRGWELADPGPRDADVVIVDVQQPLSLSLRGIDGSGKVVWIVDEPHGIGWGTVIYPGCSHALLRREFADARWNYLPIRSRPEDIAYLRNISGMSAAVLATAIGCHKLAVTYGGQRALECMCLGTPVVVTPRNEGERLIAKTIVEHGAGVQADEDDAESIARELLQNEPALQVMSERARSLVDGLGCQRVAEEIEHLCSRA